MWLDTAKDVLEPAERDFLEDLLYTGVWSGDGRYVYKVPAEELAEVVTATVRQKVPDYSVSATSVRTYRRKARRNAGVHHRATRTDTARRSGEDLPVTDQD